MSLTTATARAETEKMRAKSKNGAKVVSAGGGPEGGPAGGRATRDPIAQLAGDESVIASLGELSDEQQTELKELTETIAKETKDAEQAAGSEQGVTAKDIISSLQMGWNVKLRNIVGEDMMKRLTQIELQKAGAEALNRPNISNNLRITPQQLQAADGDPQKILDALTDEQKTIWNELIGEPFESQ